MPPEQKSETTTERIGRPGDPCVMVIFGATGDLTKRMLLPALCNLAAVNLLPRQFAIVGYAHANNTDDSFRDQLTQDVKALATNPIDPHVWDWFRERIHYVQGEFSDPAGYQRLAAKLAEVEKDHGTLGSRFYYLAVGPKFLDETGRAVASIGRAPAPRRRSPRRRPPRPRSPALSWPCRRRRLRGRSACRHPTSTPVGRRR